ncbi:PREDICTED: 1-acyl-sn-glycerol-3-phosphate acyltransferase gamma-like [Eufriesea mexicana]|uniref:1-acyl-sn-glycerol-3-phosphate acyltransferase gamma-like n=1 Tax=Eufriesea mexicana TaxID=516756 RepID=UPI00083C7B04|nr:PREDICTED: 1-acyl-sn-glycerol-3-phosphate acyltransferase gamma-like [Eufriesea mexicana]
MGLVSVLKQSTMIHMILAIIFFTSGLIINFSQCLLYFGLRPFFRYFYRKIIYYLCYSLHCQLVFLAEWWSGSDIIIYVDKETFEKYFAKEPAFVIMNHSYELDWVMGWLLCERLGILGNTKAYVKKEIRYIPTLGWSWKFADCLFLERNWEQDKNTIGSQIKEISNYTGAWLVLFAEGTRLTPEKLEASQKFAKKSGLPILKYHLIPRTKGFAESVLHLEPKIRAIYDIQIEFKADSPNKPTITSILYGKPVVAYMHINRIPVEKVPKDEKGAAEWLHKLYEEKDRLAESFHETGDFFATSGVAKVDKIILKRRYYSLVNTVCWAVIVLVPMIYYLINLFFLPASAVYFSIGVGIIFLFYLFMCQMIKMTKISHSSSYGINDKKSK